MKLIIPGELPTSNEVIAASKSHYMVYANLKRKHTQLVQLSAKGLRPVDKADFEITWYCQNRRKDKDNIMFGQKFLFDGLVDAGVIKNDGWSQIGNVSHRFEVDRDEPRIEVLIKEVAK